MEHGKQSDECYFLRRLPLELRLYIYRIVIQRMPACRILRRDIKRSCCYQRRNGVLNPLKRGNPNPALPLLFGTCSQIYEEGTFELLFKTTFVFRLKQKQSKFWTDTNQQFYWPGQLLVQCLAIPSQPLIFRNVRHIELDYPVLYLRSIWYMAHFPAFENGISQENAHSSFLQEIQNLHTVAKENPQLRINLLINEFASFYTSARHPLGFRGWHPDGDYNHTHLLAAPLLLFEEAARRDMFSSRLKVLVSCYDGAAVPILPDDSIDSKFPDSEIRLDSNSSAGYHVRRSKWLSKSIRQLAPHFEHYKLFSDACLQCEDFFLD